MTQTMVRRASRVLGSGVSRRRFLSRVALAGCALAVAPVRYLTRPVSAASIIRCAHCGSGRCCDGWTAFCCTLTGENVCPRGSFIGGWWKCTNYTGSGACAKEGVRYYVDCNRMPGFTKACSEGCHCANNKCSHRSTCCNVFRYGQCGAEIAGVTEVVCRVVQCTNPGYSYVGCDSTLMINNATCSHEEGCL